ncbi:MAG: PepSY domain-containing protein [Methylomonas sp.]|jgi:uncharacterized membrane protein YkoI|uniref:PepSY domain-containing protein n=1 Tax=Methylomonas sp. TaxID=418 RepID=UPI0025FA60C3|nr:PepSY domain-containing protein [Methylomonas sp.]MCK9606412.1 PepSY domain-containing protein [Methylomonas sp.]
MKNKQAKIVTTIFAMMMVGSAINLARATEAKDEEVNELLLFSQAKISLQEAITAAEQKTGGKAMEAELNDESAAVQFEVEIVKNGKVHEVIVDGKTGKVLKISLEDDAKEGAENGKE